MLSRSVLSYTLNTATCPFPDDAGQCIQLDKMIAVFLQASVCVRGERIVVSKGGKWLGQTWTFGGETWKEC